MGQVYQRGLVLILSGPPGCGKDTVINRIVAEEEHITRILTTTTRPMRRGEAEGVTYNYISHAEFEEKLKEGYFLEHNNFIGNYYGTPRHTVEEKLSEGKDLITDIDWNGARSLGKLIPADVVRIFLLPPTLEELEKRLEKRNTETPEAIKARMEQGKLDIAHYEEYDYVVLNDDLDNAVRRVQRILRAERLRRHRQPWLPEYISALLSGQKPTAPIDEDT